MRYTAPPALRYTHTLHVARRPLRRPVAAATVAPAQRRGGADESTQSLPSPFCPTHRIRLVHLVPPPQTVNLFEFSGPQKSRSGWGFVEKQIALVCCAVPCVLGPVRQGFGVISGSKSKPSQRQLGLVSLRSHHLILLLCIAYISPCLTTIIPHAHTPTRSVSKVIVITTDRPQQPLPFRF